MLFKRERIGKWDGRIVYPKTSNLNFVSSLSLNLNDVTLLLDIAFR